MGVILSTPPSLKAAAGYRSALQVVLFESTKRYGVTVVPETKADAKIVLDW